MVKRKGNPRFKEVTRKGRKVYVLKKASKRKITRHDRSVDRRNLKTSSKGKACKICHRRK